MSTTFLVIVCALLVGLVIYLDCGRWPSRKPGRPEHDEVELSPAEISLMARIEQGYHLTAPKQRDRRPR